jgi:hypothetical protein
MTPRKQPPCSLCEGPCHDWRRHNRVLDGARSRADLIDDVETLRGVDPETAARRIAKKPEAIARGLYRAGRPDLARPFEAAAKRARRAS